MNKITLTGTLDADPEIRYTRDGQAETTLRLAADDECAGWVVRVRGMLAENVALSLMKGHGVIATGRFVWAQAEARTELWADHLGVSLAEATCEVTRTAASR